jgi:chromosome segregation ATPase
MAVKGIKDTEKVAVGAIRTAIQTWLAPQLSGISERLAHVEGRLEGIEGRLGGMDHRIEGVEKAMESLRNEMRAEISSVHSEIRRLDNVADLRERLASLEANRPDLHQRTTLRRNDSSGFSISSRGISPEPDLLSDAMIIGQRLIRSTS